MKMLNKKAKLLTTAILSTIAAFSTSAKELIYSDYADIINNKDKISISQLYDYVKDKNTQPVRIINIITMKEGMLSAYDGYYELIDELIRDERYINFQNELKIISAHGLIKKVRFQSALNVLNGVDTPYSNLLQAKINELMGHYGESYAILANISKEDLSLFSDKAIDLITKDIINGEEGITLFDMTDEISAKVEEHLVEYYKSEGLYNKYLEFRHSRLNKDNSREELLNLISEAKYFSKPLKRVEYMMEYITLFESTNNISGEEAKRVFSYAKELIGLQDSELNLINIEDIEAAQNNIVSIYPEYKVNHLENSIMTIKNHSSDSYVEKNIELAKLKGDSSIVVELYQESENFTSKQKNEIFQTYFSLSKGNDALFYMAKEWADTNETCSTNIGNSIAYAYKGHQLFGGDRYDEALKCYQMVEFESLEVTAEMSQMFMDEYAISEYSVAMLQGNVDKIALIATTTENRLILNKALVYLLNENSALEQYWDNYSQQLMTNKNVSNKTKFLVAKRLSGGLVEKGNFTLATEVAKSLVPNDELMLADISAKNDKVTESIDHYLNWLKVTSYKNDQEHFRAYKYIFSHKDEFISCNNEKYEDLLSSGDRTIIQYENANLKYENYMKEFDAVSVDSISSDKGIIGAVKSLNTIYKSYFMYLNSIKTLPANASNISHNTLIFMLKFSEKLKFLSGNSNNKKLVNMLSNKSKLLKAQALNKAEKILDERIKDVEDKFVYKSYIILRDKDEKK
ncbi:hypothetical protein ACNZ70_001710 [Vibrio mimicus]